MFVWRIFLCKSSDINLWYSCFMIYDPHTLRYSWVNILHKYIILSEYTVQHLFASFLSIINLQCNACLYYFATFKIRLLWLKRTLLINSNNIFTTLNISTYVEMLYSLRQRNEQFISKYLLHNCVSLPLSLLLELRILLSYKNDWRVWKDGLLLLFNGC